MWILGGASDSFGPAYAVAPVWDWQPRADSFPAGLVGARAARNAFAMAGLSTVDVDVLELYDPFSFEIIRQLEAFGFCGPGEGGPFVQDGHIGPGGTFPVTTDGGTMSFSHPGINAQQLQRVIRATEQLRGTCTSSQVDGAEVALCSNGGAGALFCDVLLLGTGAPVSLLLPQVEGIPVPRPGQHGRQYWDGCRRHTLLYQRCAECSFRGLAAFSVCASCHATSPDVGGERGERRPVQLDGGVAATRSLVPGSLRAGGDPTGRGFLDVERGHRLRARGAAAWTCPSPSSSTGPPTRSRCRTSAPREGRVASFVVFQWTLS